MGLHVVVCQLDIAWEDKAENHRRAAALLEQARPPQGSLVVLPEMFSTGFSMNVDATAEGDERPSERFLAETARRLEACTLGGVVTRERPGALALNQAVAFGPDGSWRSPATPRFTRSRSPARTGASPADGRS